MKAAVYILLLLGNSMVVSTSPLCFEFAVEKLYPVPEVSQERMKKKLTGGVFLLKGPAAMT